MKKENVTNGHKQFKDIILTGGVSTIPGLGERLNQEIKTRYGDLNVVLAPKRQYAAWRGASLISSLTRSKSQWISKADYGEYGSQIIHRKYV